ncbi:cytochrome b/b6 domain-containing protein [Demequina sp. NBRC 110055]|uniref:cytochrome b/b6 domain-containing protein n=1 Tax=Demequina sp. NBRC 110055 TaxID=1570344 RepID=UPI0009FC4F51|nr:cytochrome b/b6 domain-containing protein [Demequina sp. NBRC 110055]
MSGVRRGLPRVPGGEPWPPAREVPAWVADAVAAEEPTLDESASVAHAVVEPAGSPRGTVPLRRGLPRVAGGQPWPDEGFAPAWVEAPSDDDAAGVTGTTPEPPADAAAPTDAPLGAESATVAPEAAPPSRTARRSLHPHARRAMLAAVMLAIVGAVLVVLARWYVGSEGGADFIARYPGRAPQPEETPVGIPTWLSWQHFFNVFLMVLVVRTGLQVRRQSRPPAYWTSRGPAATRIGLPSWTHQALDVLWVVNGVVYVVMLFATGQWMRIVPTSWDVIPGVVSTTLQYLSLEWPAEDGWVYYNSLQQIVYFLTVFVAAPLAIASGVRMSMYWRGSQRWDRLYPASVARAIHFPVMIYFVAFVVGHVGLVLATGARQNLNHMYAGRDDASWLGVVIFALSLVVIVGAVVALRPMFVAPVASKFGTVSSR